MLINRWPALLVMTASLLACGDGSNGDQTGPDGDIEQVDDSDSQDLSISTLACPQAQGNEPSWPEPALPFPPCKPFEHGFSLPEMVTPSGLIGLYASAEMQPVGYAEEVTIAVFVPGTETIDGEASGALEVQADAGIEVLSSAPLVSGRGRLVVQLNKPGLVSLQVSLVGDGRQGKLQLFGFVSRLPVWEIDINAADLAVLMSSSATKKHVPMTLRRDGKWATGWVRLHGGTSKSFAKKSFRLDLDGGQPLPDDRRHLVLRSEWGDRTLLRNWLALQVFARGTSLPASTARFVHLRVNARYHGVVNEVQRIDTRFLVDHGRDPNGSLYESDPPHELGIPGGNLTPLPDLVTYKQVYAQHAGTQDYVDLLTLIELALQLPEAAFIESIVEIVRVDEVLVYLAVMAVIQNQDHIKKNYYLYRDPAAKDCRWEVWPWDLDLSFGRLWTAEKQVLDDEIFHDADPWVGVNKGHAFYNQLYDRLLHVPKWRTRYLQFIAKLLQYPFTEAFIQDRLAHAVCQMTPDLLADANKRSDNTDYLARVAEIGAFVKKRRVFLENLLEKEAGRASE